MSFCTSGVSVFLWILRIYNNTCFYRTPPVVASIYAYTLSTTGFMYILPIWSIFRYYFHFHYHQPYNLIKTDATVPIFQLFLIFCQFKPGVGYKSAIVCLKSLAELLKLQDHLLSTKILMVGWLLQLRWANKNLAPCKKDENVEFSLTSIFTFTRCIPKYAEQRRIQNPVKHLGCSNLRK